MDTSKERQRSSAQTAFFILYPVLLLRVLDLKEQVARHEQIALLLLGTDLARKILDNLPVELVGNGDLHLHLHALKHNERPPRLEHVTGLDRVGENLPGYRARHV